jgi:multiple sugar transport system permease protein
MTLSNVKLYQAERRFAFFFLLPCAILLLFIVIFPLIYNVYMSLFRINLLGQIKHTFVGLMNYAQIFTDSIFYQSLLRTLLYSVPTLVVETVLALLVALLLNMDYPGRGFIQTFLMLPFVATPVAVAYVWRIMYNPEMGLIDYFLRSLGLPIWKGIYSGNTAMISLMIVDIWQWTPFLALIFLAALLSMPKDPIEAADIDGASKLQKLTYVIIPLIKDIMAIGIALRLIDLYKTFDIIYTLTGGGPGRKTETLNIHIYHKIFIQYEVGYASALTVVAIIIISFLLGRFAKQTKLAD